MYLFYRRQIENQFQGIRSEENKMTMNELLDSGICLEGILIINKYDEDEPECLFEDLEPSGDGWKVPEEVRNMEIKFMYATTYEKADGIETAALIIEVE